MRINLKQKQQGFTLIELLVVIAIVGLLASIILVGLEKTRVRARDAKRKADMRQLTNAIEVYMLQKGEYPFGELDTGAFNTPGGGIDFSSIGSFLPDLQSEGIMAKPVFDPVNNSPLSYIYVKNNGIPAGLNQGCRIAGCGSSPEPKALLCLNLKKARLRIIDTQAVGM
jgi:prepilin-type N-terminal cleavage/methylation domain-containing protein